MVAGCRLALGAGQCKLFVCLRMQKHRKVLAHWHKALLQHQFGRCTHYHPVAVLHFQPEQGIPYRTADQVGLHTSRRAGPPQARLRPPGGQCSTRSGKRGGHMFSVAGDRALRKRGNRAPPARHQSRHALRVGPARAPHKRQWLASAVARRFSGACRWARSRRRRW